MHTISTVSAQAAMEYIFANPSRRDFASSTAAMMAIIRGISISWETTFAPMANVGGTLISTYARISSKCRGAQADGGEQHPKPTCQLYRGGEHLFFAAQVFSAYAEQRGTYHGQRDESRNGYRLPGSRSARNRSRWKRACIRLAGKARGGAATCRISRPHVRTAWWCRRREHAAGVEQHGEREVGDGCAQHFVAGVTDEERAHSSHKAADERGPGSSRPIWRSGRRTVRRAAA